MTLEIHPQQPFGALVTGLSLAADIEADTLARLREAWLNHQVLSFPDQPLTHAQLERVTLMFGQFGEETYLRGLPEHPHVVAVERKPDETPKPFGTGWHSDWSFQQTPPAATLLHSKIIPPSGGDTLFANGYLAYEALSQARRKQIDALTVIHSARRSYSHAAFAAGGGKARSMNIVPNDNAYAEQRHPMVRVHPETQRRALWVNSVYSIAIDELPQLEGEQLLNELLQHATLPEFTYRLTWQPDMLTIWDNRCLQHVATGGYDGYHRLMHRTTIAGDAPRGPTRDHKRDS